MTSSLSRSVKVSVIIPLYNKAPYIKRALESVLAQTVQDFELIVVNDGSTDGSEKIVEKYLDSRITLINQENQGVSVARNNGVLNAKTELIAFLDADDEWLPKFLETILRLREKYPKSGLYGTGSKRIISNNYKRYIIYEQYKPDEGDRIFSSFFKENMDYCNHYPGQLSPGQLIITSAMVVNKTIFNLVGGFPQGFPQSEDRCLMGKIALVSDVAYSPDILAIYDNTTTNNTSRSPVFLTDPFTEYVASLPQELIVSRSDYYDIIDYCETNILYIAYRNIRDCPNNKEVRKQLQKVRLPIQKKEKIKLYLLCLCPKYLQQKIIKNIEFIRSLVNKFSNIRKDEIL